MQAKILPRSEVGVANTRTPFPAIVKIPTVFSGLAYKFNSFSLKLQQDIYIYNNYKVCEKERKRVLDLGFGTRDEINGVGLSLKTGGRVITVPHPF
jgi:hypothetical protein